MLDLARFAIIGKGNTATTLAARLRRGGTSCHTEWTGKRANQYRRAKAKACDVIDADNPQDVERLIAWLDRMDGEDINRG